MKSETKPVNWEKEMLTGMKKRTTWFVKSVYNKFIRKDSEKKKIFFSFLIFL